MTVRPRTIRGSACGALGSRGLEAHAHVLLETDVRALDADAGAQGDRVERVRLERLRHEDDGPSVGLEATLGRWVEREVAIDIDRPVLVERQLDAGVERHLGALVVGQRGHDVEWLLDREGPRSGQRVVGRPQPESVALSGLERLRRRHGDTAGRRSRSDAQLDWRAPPRGPRPALKRVGRRGSPG